MLSSLLSSLITVVLSGCFWTLDSVFVPLVLSKLYPSFPSHCHSSTRLLWEEWISWSLFLPTCLPLWKSVWFGTKPYETHYPLLRYIPLPWVPTICYPTCLSTSPQLVSLSSLHYRASFQVSSIWDGEESFYPLSFLSLLVALVFPTAFFTSLLTTVVLFRCFWDPRFSLSPTCV